MPRHAPRPAAFTLAGLAALVVLSGAGTALPAAPPILAELPPGAGASTLAQAREREAQAAAAVDSLRQALRPGHLFDPMPDVDRGYGLEQLRTDYADMQRRAAGYRATLGDQHPTLVAADQILSDLRGQILAATRKALAAAEHDAAAARAAVAGAEREAAAAQAAQDARMPADVTGAIPPAPPTAAAPRRPPRMDPAPRREDAAQPVLDVGGGASPRMRAAAGAAGLLALLSAAWAALQLLRSFRRPPRSRYTLQRREPALATDVVDRPAPAAAAAPSPAPAPAPAAAAQDMPALGTLPLPPGAARADLAGRVAREPRSPLALAAQSLHAAALARLGRAPGERVTLLVAGLGEARGADADAAALALAAAVAAAGGRVALLEARREGRLRRSVVPEGASAVLVEAGGAVRTAYGLDMPAGTLAVLPCDASEAAAAARPGPARLKGLAGFDLVVVVGEDIAALARGADLVVVTASPAVTAAEVAAAARLCVAAERPCGGLMLEAPGVAAAPPLPAAAPPLPAGGPARRRPASPPPRAAGRPQLRGTLEPLRRHAG